MTRTIPQHESLTVEFKSDQRRLSDADLIATVVCLANSEGGEIYIGVEDDGRVTGRRVGRERSASYEAA